MMMPMLCRAMVPLSPVPVGKRFPAYTTGVGMKRSRATGTVTTVTLQDVATAAGVSLATASRALHGGTRVVTAELRERVQKAAAELGYTSHGPAQALARATTPVVGLIVHDITDAYFSAMAIGAMRVAHDNGLLVLVCNTFRDPRLELDYVARLRAQRARGVLLFGSGFTERSYQSKQHLTDLGHRRIGVVSGPANLLVNQERLRGFREQLRALDVELPAEQIVK